MQPKHRTTPDVERSWRAAVHSCLHEQLGWKQPDDDSAFKAFDTLVAKGCDPVFLLSMLGTLAEAPRVDKWQELSGFAGPDRLRTAVKRLRTCAEDVEKLLASVIGRARAQEVCDINLPSTLRRLADHFERTTKSITPRRNPFGRFTRAAIVRHVRARTGGFNDTLVTDILCPVLGHRDALPQGQWRHDNALLLLAAHRQT